MASVAGIVAYLQTGSSAVLGFGLENIIDLASSVVVLWRFWMPYSGSLEENEHSKLLQKREKRSSLAIAFIMLVMAWFLSVAALDDLANETDENVDYESELLGLAIPFLFVFGFLSMVKFHYADKLSSPALKKDAICSLFGALLSFSVAFNTLVIGHDDSLWWLDPMVAIAVSLACFAIGSYSIFKNIREETPILELSWWLTDPVEASENEKNVINTGETGDSGKSTEIELPGQNADIV